MERKFDTKIQRNVHNAIAFIYFLEKASPLTTVLNFANPRKPGGGFMEGSQGREEQICHATTLLPTLEKHMNRLECFQKSEQKVKAELQLLQEE